MTETHTLTCHCGAVELRVPLSDGLSTARRCDCSFCRRRGAAAVSAPLDGVEIIRGADNLTLYQWNTKTAQHYFCKTCGIKSFYVPRSNPDGISVNARCLDPETISKVRITNFDGRNWEKHADELKHFSQDGV